MSFNVAGFMGDSPRLRALTDNEWLAFVFLVIAVCLGCWMYKDSMFLSRAAAPPMRFQRSKLPKEEEKGTDVPPKHLPPSSTPDPTMRYLKASRHTKRKSSANALKMPVSPKPNKPYEAFLVVDIEGTCTSSSDFNYPNEIIEFPVSLLKWNKRTADGNAGTLTVVDEFRTFVRPTWRPTLSEFCTRLTGITQEQADGAPIFSEVLINLETFLVKHGLLDGVTGKRLVKYCWCSDGPFDIRDFVVKQCFISRVKMPHWVQGDVLDIRSAVMEWVNVELASNSPSPLRDALRGVTRRSLNIPEQLRVLSLPKFEGRQHSGIDDTRNLAKIVSELARRGRRLLPNTVIHPGKRWRWMGKHGRILEEELT